MTFFDASIPATAALSICSSPYVILAHYTELDWVGIASPRRGGYDHTSDACVQAASFGVEPDLVRFSIGLENTDDLVAVFRRALAAIPE